MPIVAMVSFVGIYGISGSSFDLLVMIGFGVLGWILSKARRAAGTDHPRHAARQFAMENNLRRAITIRQRQLVRPWSTARSPSPSGALALIGFVLPIIFGKVLKARMRMKKDEEGAVVD